LLPRLVAPLITGPEQAAWLLATPAFRRVAFDGRGSTWDIAGQTTDPDRALAKVLARDALFNEDVRRDAEALQLRTIEVDLVSTLDELARCVAEALGLA